MRFSYDTIFLKVFADYVLRSKSSRGAKTFKLLLKQWPLDVRRHSLTHVWRFNFFLIGNRLETLRTKLRLKISLIIVKRLLLLSIFFFFNYNILIRQVFQLFKNFSQKLSHLPISFSTNHIMTPSFPQKLGWKTRNECSTPQVKKKRL